MSGSAPLRRKNPRKARKQRLPTPFPCSEGSKRRHDVAGIVGMRRNPHIHIRGGARISMISHRIPPDKQILNVVFVEQTQELFESRAVD